MRVMLSVSPNGSYWLKPLLHRITDKVNATFSIPERIVLVETMDRFIAVPYAYNFQYPRTDRIG